jgi:hypothetical protein
VDLVDVRVEGESAPVEVEGTVATVDLGRTWGRADGAVRLDVTFVAHLPPLVERTGCVPGFCFAGQWYPKVPRMDERGRWSTVAYHHNAEYDAEPARYDVTVTAPAGWTVGATGGAERVEEGADGWTWRFGGTLKDVAFAAGDDARMLVDPGEPELRVMHPPERGDEARRTVEIERRCLRRMAELYGPYPWETLTTVVVPAGASGAGGMEYPSLITTYGSDPSWSPARVRDPVLYHEIVHQVFFGILDTDEPREPWVDEGLTTYAALRLQADVESTAFPVVGRVQGAALSGFEYERLALSWRARWPPVRAASWEYSTRGAYHAGVYARASLVLETMRRVWGDGRIERALGTLVREHRGRRVTGRDVLDQLERTYGPEVVERFVLPALDDPEPFGFSVASLEGGVRVRRTGSAAVPVSVLLVHEDGRRRTVRIEGDRPETVVEAEGVSEALVDPQMRVALDGDRLDDGLRSSSLPPAGRTASLASLVTLVMQLAGTLVMP